MNLRAQTAKCKTLRSHQPPLDECPDHTDTSTTSWSPKARIAADSHLRCRRCRIFAENDLIVAQSKAICMLDTCTHSSTNFETVMVDENLTESFKELWFGIGKRDLMMFVYVCGCNKIRFASVGSLCQERCCVTSGRAIASI